MQNGGVTNLKIFSCILVIYNTVYTISLKILLRSYIFFFSILNTAAKIDVIPWMWIWLKKRSYLITYLLQNHIQCNFVWRINLIIIHARNSFWHVPLSVCYSILLRNYQEFNSWILKEDSCGYETNADFASSDMSSSPSSEPQFPFFICNMDIILLNSQGQVLKTKKQCCATQVEICLVVTPILK